MQRLTTCRNFKKTMLRSLHRYYQMTNPVSSQVWGRVSSSVEEYHVKYRSNTSVLLNCLAVIFSTASLLTIAYSEKDNNPLVTKNDSSRYNILEVDGEKSFTTVIIGGGTAGCTVAYLLAKWMEEKDVPGTVLLVERGHNQSVIQGSDLRLKSWLNMWGSFGEAHMTIHKNGDHYPVPATDHRGLGGCSAHDTRINFQLTREQLQRMADYMGWQLERIQTYYQAALNLIPVSRAIPSSRKERIHDDVIRILTEPEHSSKDDITLHRVLASDEKGKVAVLPRQDDEFNTVVVPNSVAEVSMSMYGDSGENEGADEIRYVSAYLVHEKVRPKNLKVVCNMIADKIVFESKVGNTNDVIAKSVVMQDEEGKSWIVDLVVDEASGQRGDVVITNGSLGATGLLQRSGIGPAEVLRKAGVEVLVDNPEVGHGVDHLEISLVHEWDKNNSVTRGGPTGWPLVLFSDIDCHESFTRRNVEKPFPMYRPNTYFQAHFGAGTMDPNFDEPVVQMTPLAVNPDPEAGFRACINSKNATDNLLVVAEDQSSDLNAMGHAVRKGVKMLAKLERAGLCGPRILPPPELPLSDMPKLMQWIKENHWTVYHWACTCKAGLPGIGSVADETFRVRLPAGKEGVISNLFVGSAASLPEMTEPNPHLTITAFSVALAEELLKSRCFALNSCPPLHSLIPSDISKALTDLDFTNGSIPTCVIRRQGDERPALWDSVVRDHHSNWMAFHANNIEE